MALTGAEATLISAGIGAGTSLISGGGGSASETGRATSKVLRKNIKYLPRLEEAMFDKKMALFDKHGIHPLFGLGKAGNYSPISGMPGQGDTRAARAGQHLADMPTDYVNAKQRKELFELEKRRTAAEIMLLENQARSIGSPGKSMGEVAALAGKSGVDLFQVKPQDKVKSTPLVEQVPRQVIAGTKGDEATQPGESALWTKWRVAKDLVLEIPAQEMQDALENPLNWYPMIQVNKQAIKNWIKSQAKEGRFLTEPQKKLVNIYNQFIKKFGDK